MPTPATLIHLRFDEATFDIPPSDDVGSLGDLAPRVGDAVPDVVSAFTGFGRLFTVGKCLQAVDLVPGSTLSNRDVTIDAIVKWDFDTQVANGDLDATICIRGIYGGPAAEIPAYALMLRMVNAGQRIGGLALRWADSAGAQFVAPRGEFVMPPASNNGYMLVTATRHWVSSTQVEIQYYVGDVLVGDHVVTAGDIGGATTGTFRVGRLYEGGNGYFEGVIDEIRVRNYHVTQEEVAATWARLSKWQPRGYRAIRDLMPPGAPISDDPGSRIQKLLRVCGHAIGYAAAQVENVRSNLMPDRAYGAALEQWEGLLGEAPAAGDVVPKRRKRIVSHFSQRAGSSIPGVQATVSDMLALAPSQLQFLGFDNTQRDDFSLGLRAERWWADPPSQWTIASGALRVQAANGANILFDGTTRNWYFCLLSVDGTPKWLPGAPSCQAFVKVTPTTLPPSSQVGVVFWDWARLNAFFLGVRNNAGTIQVVSERYLHGVSQGVTVHATTSLTTHWLQLRQTTGTALIQDPTGETLQPHLVAWSTTGPTSGFTSASGIQFCYCVNWIGMYARASVAAIGTALDASFDDVAIRAGRGTRPFRWYVFRDPALPGAPDLLGARGAVDRLKQALTQASVITSKSVLCNNANSGCGRGPLGGF